MSNLFGCEAATRLKLLPGWVRSKVMSTVSSSAPERKAMYLPSGEIFTLYICGRRAKFSMAWGAGAAAATAAAQSNAEATQAFNREFIGHPLVRQPIVGVGGVSSSFGRVGNAGS